MTTRFLAAAALIALLACPDQLSAHEADTHLVWCIQPDATKKRECESTRSDFRKLYKAAFRKDYQAQRNLAHILWDGREFIQPDRVSSCAWRMVIRVMARKADKTDEDNMQLYCGRLDASDQEKARTLARTIAARITKGGKIDENIYDKPLNDPTLDGTAQPLQ